MGILQVINTGCLYDKKKEHPFLNIAVIIHRCKLKHRWLDQSSQRLHSLYWKVRSEEHTSELQSRFDLVCRLLLEKKKETQRANFTRDRVRSTLRESKQSLDI